MSHHLFPPVVLQDQLFNQLQLNQRANQQCNHQQPHPLNLLVNRHTNHQLNPADNHQVNLLVNQADNRHLSQADNQLGNQHLNLREIQPVNRPRSLRAHRHILHVFSVLLENIFQILFVLTQLLWHAHLASLDIDAREDVLRLYPVPWERINHHMAALRVHLVPQVITTY